MVWIDYVIISIIGLSSLMSLKRGFISEVLSLMIWICTFYIVSHFYQYLSIYLIRFENTFIRQGISIGILFIVTLVVGAIINFFISSLVMSTGLSGINRFLGICFGVLRGVFIVSFILFFLDVCTDFSHSVDWQNSLLIPKFSEIIIWLFSYLKSSTSFFESIEELLT